MLLAIDTSQGTSVALLDSDGSCLVERTENNTRMHAEVIGVFLGECFEVSGCSPRDVETVVLGMGPGPFTGLRVGVVAGRSFAFARKCELFPLSSHDAVAFEVSESSPACDEFIVHSDAKRHERYWSKYSRDRENLFVRLDDPGVCKEGFLPKPELERFSGDHISAFSLGSRALQLKEFGRNAEADAVSYVRQPDVTLAKAKKRVTA